MQGNDKVCKLSCTSWSNWKSEGWSGVISLYTDISDAGKVTMARVPGEFPISLFTTQNLFWSSSSSQNDNMVFVRRVTTKAFLFARKRCQPLLNWCAVSVLPRSSFSSRQLPTWSLTRSLTTPSLSRFLILSSSHVLYLDRLELMGLWRWVVYAYFHYCKSFIKWWYFAFGWIGWPKTRKIAYQFGRGWTAEEENQNRQSCYPMDLSL